jgi:multimeric flavodoxin WrbA
LKFIIHDLNEQDFSSLRIAKNDDMVINANMLYAPCVGCFHCWVKSPGTCKINDGLKNNGALLGHCEELIIISQHCYGGYSETVKRVLDRSISTLLPFFTFRSGKMRHRQRYRINRKSFTVFLYGDFLETEKNIAVSIVEANRNNMGFQNAALHIIQQFNEIGTLLK